MAMTQIKSNGKNTCRNSKLLLGRSFKNLDDKTDIEEEKFFQLCDLVAQEDGDVAYKVNYRDEECVFSPSQVGFTLVSSVVWMYTRFERSFGNLHSFQV